jgi:hypothetical protein
MKTYEGSCHCGRVRFRVIADLPRVSECNCSICAKKGFLHLIVPPEWSVGRWDPTYAGGIRGLPALRRFQIDTLTDRHSQCDASNNSDQTIVSGA